MILHTMAFCFRNFAGNTAGRVIIYIDAPLLLNYQFLSLSYFSFLAVSEGGSNLREGWGRSTFN